MFANPSPANLSSLIPDQPLENTIKVIHYRIRGRVRLSINALYEKTELCKALTTKLSLYAFIHACRANPRTTSLLIDFAPDKSLTYVVAITQRALNGILSKPLLMVSSQKERAFGVSRFQV